MLLRYIEPFYFFMALGLGMLFVYIFSPQLEVVYKYPTPENANKITYIDKAQVCYKYKQEQVDCKKSNGKVKQHILQ
tara:strand:+ start:167 stop:397 length:231 start_codon:yes stop_codon:yes gene_type:complete